ncbi:MAG: hypothetical protein P8Y16_08265 [Sulfurimonas sp.]
MFFSNNKNNDTNQELEGRIAALEKELNFYKEIADFSQDEIVVVVDNSGKYIYENVNAKSMIKEHELLAKELHKNNDIIELN